MHFIKSNMIFGAFFSVFEFLVKSMLAILGVVLVFLCLLTLPAEINPLVPNHIQLNSQIDPNLLTALGTILIAVSALYIGSKIRRYQELEVEARASLALNVNLDVNTFLVDGKKVIELIVEVHNVSRKSWYVPMSYFFLNNTLVNREIPVGSNNRNMADYGITLCKLQPDERDMFFRQIVLDEETSKDNSLTTITIELIGASDKYLNRKNERMKFIDFMRSENGMRHGFLCIGRCKDAEDEYYGDRCFIDEKGEINRTATAEYYDLLQDMMIWTREKVVN